MPRKVWVPYLWDASNKEKETDSKHSKWLHSSETVYLNIFLILLFIPPLIYSNLLYLLVSTRAVIGQFCANFENFFFRAPD